jgi:hypothetical protein
MSVSVWVQRVVVLGVAYQSSGCVDAECPGVCAVHPCWLREAEETVRRHVDLCIVGISWKLQGVNYEVRGVSCACVIVRLGFVSRGRHASSNY